MSWGEDVVIVGLWDNVCTTRIQVFMVKLVLLVYIGGNKIKLEPFLV